MTEARTSTDYSHSFHAGNIGDVWKHCALVAWLEGSRAGSRSRLYLETHAGIGRYRLGPTGEWTEGVGRLAGGGGASGPRAVVRYLEVLHSLGFDSGGDRRGATYPGSPAIALALLGAEDRAVLHELAPEACAALAANLAAEARAQVRGGDGLAALGAGLAEAEREGREALVVIDPPYTAKEEWLVVPDALAAAHAGQPNARFVLWYPIKSLTRPQALLQRLREAGVPATALELVTTPLDLKRKRLNGSGVLFVNPPLGVVEQVAEAAPALGPRCATHACRWSMRALGW